MPSSSSGSGCGRCSSSTCGWARGPARPWRSASSMPPSPSATGWRRSMPRRCHGTAPTQHDRPPDVVTIVLVRHASTAWSGVRYCGRSDPPLSPHRARRGAPARRVAGGRPAARHLGSCPARRAGRPRRQRPSSTRPRLASVEIDDRWREADLGIAEGRTFDELAAIAPDLAAALARRRARPSTGQAARPRVTGRPGGRRLGRPCRRRAADRRRHPCRTVHACPALADGRPISPDDLVAPAARAASPGGRREGRHGRPCYARRA